MVVERGWGKRFVNLEEFVLKRSCSALNTVHVKRSVKRVDSTILSLGPLKWMVALGVMIRSLAH